MATDALFFSLLCSQYLAPSNRPTRCSVEAVAVAVTVIVKPLHWQGSSVTGCRNMQGSPRKPRE
jgi:hypothetical protein